MGIPRKHDERRRLSAMDPAFPFAGLNVQITHEAGGMRDSTQIGIAFGIGFIVLTVAFMLPLFWQCLSGEGDANRSAWLTMHMDTITALEEKHDEARHGA